MPHKSRRFTEKEFRGHFPLEEPILQKPKVYHYALLQSCQLTDGKITYQEEVKFHHRHKMYLKGIWDYLYDTQDPLLLDAPSLAENWDLTIVEVDPEDGSCKPVVWVSALLNSLDGYANPLDFLEQNPERDAAFYMAGLDT